MSTVVWAETDVLFVDAERLKEERKMNNKKRKISLLAVPLIILLVFLMASCTAKESITEVKPLQTEAIDAKPQDALSFKKLSDNLGDCFS